MRNSSLPDSEPQSHPQHRKSQSWWWRSGKYYYFRLLRLEGSPKAIARGVSVGMFAGFFPLFGLQTIIGLLLAALFRGNKLAAAAATWVSNPFTYIPIYSFNFAVGRWLLGGLLGGQNIALETIDWNSPEMLEVGSDFALSLFAGCFVVGLIAAIWGYFLSLAFIQRYRQARRSRKP
ncbi:MULTISPECIES: DUF2062 domain-containing protein [Spirulina sp. CCY15215]|uniref:DUF2062 domain-containing protein n=1 Tax=Spirulina sp. CCY15215 TaxID=2767591 RepID=UPI00194F5964|nr:DUF2062 domain-containing protein [Spirulina major]